MVPKSKDKSGKNYKMQWCVLNYDEHDFYQFTKFIIICILLTHIYINQ